MPELTKGQQIAEEVKKKLEEKGVLTTTDTTTVKITENDSK